MLKQELQVLREGKRHTQATTASAVMKILQGSYYHGRFCGSTGRACSMLKDKGCPSRKDFKNGQDVQQTMYREHGLHVSQSLNMYESLPFY